MNIKILDSWLREYLKTEATPNEIADKLSLASLSVEKIEEYGNDFLYEMEITTNRPDLFSVLGIAREAAAVLPQFGITAEFIPLKLDKPDYKTDNKSPIIIKNDPKLVNRVCAVVMEVKIQKPAKEIKERLEQAGIRSLNNVIDVTNYVMMVTGHPAHVFDFDRLNTKELIIRESVRGERITTLDNKTHTLNGGEIIAANDKGQIVDLLGVMGLLNSVVNENTKRILYFIDNNDPYHIRNASMGLGIRTEAAALNEKGVDPELAIDALYYGIKLFKETANGKQIAEIIDIYPNKPKQKTIEVSLEKINKVIGVKIDAKKSTKALTDLGFITRLNNESIKVVVPSLRANDMDIEEDVIEEIARIYGYHNLPSKLPKTEESDVNGYSINEFFWEERIKNALKYWGFTETFTYSFVSEDMYEGPVKDSVEVSNPLTKDFVYMRNSLIPSLLNVVSENKSFDEIRIFEIANVYLKKENFLPHEKLMLSGILKKKNVNFYEVKGIIEQLLSDLGIKNLSFKKSIKGGMGASLYIGKDYLGEIEVLDSDIIDFELDFTTILKNASLNKEYKPFAKYPPIIQDLTITVSGDIKTEDLVQNISANSNLIVDVSLKNSYKDSRTFHITYQDLFKNLTKQEVEKIREKIISSLEIDFKAKIK